MADCFPKVQGEALTAGAVVSLDASQMITAAPGARVGTVAEDASADDLSVLVTLDPAAP